MSATFIWQFAVEAVLISSWLNPRSRIVKLILFLISKESIISNSIATQSPNLSVRSSSEEEHQCLIFMLKRQNHFKCPISIALFKKRFYIYVGFAFNSLSHLCLFFILIKFCKVKRESISLIFLKVKKISFREAVVIKATKTITQLKLKFSFSNNLPSAYLQSSWRGRKVNKKLWSRSQLP